MTRPLKAKVDSIRAMGTKIATEPMQDLEQMNREIAGVYLATGPYGAFGVLGGSLGEALDEVKRAAQEYLAAKRGQLSDIHDRAYDTANTYVDGDGNAARTAANIPDGTGQPLTVDG